MLPTDVERYLVSRVKFKHLRLLVTVGDQRNIFKAAQALNIAQPAATKTIRDLENALELPLFERSSRGVTPTVYGEVLIRHAKLILSQVKHASEELASLAGGVTGRINIGTLLAAAPMLLPMSLARLKRERPAVSISVIEGTNDKLLSALRLGDLDMVVGRLPDNLDEEGLVSEILYYEPVAVVVRKDHPLARKRKLTLKNLLDQEWILPSPETTLRRELELAFRAEGLEPPSLGVESVSLLTNRKLLMETDMIAVMPYQVLSSYEEIGLLTHLPVDLKAAAGPIGVTLRKERELAPAALYLLEQLRSVAEEIKSGQPDIY